MTPTHYGKIWTFVGAVLLYYALNTWIVTQGGNEVFDAKLVTSNRMPAAVIGILVSSVLLFVLSLVGRAYASGSGPTWHERIPVVALQDLRTGSREGRWYQGAVLFCFAALPVAATIHFWDLIVSATVVDRATGRPVGAWDWSVTHAAGFRDPARICSTYADRMCSGNATFFPGYSMLVLVAFSLVAAVALVVYLRTVFGTDATGGRGPTAVDSPSSAPE